MKNLEIRGNEFYDGRLNKPNQDRFAVNLGSGPGGIINNGYVGFNKVYNLLKGTPENFLKGGISIKNLDNLVLEQNYLEDQDDQFSPGSIFKGIRLNACKGTRLLSNTIQGNTVTLNNLDMVGIENRDSYETDFNCNYIDQTNFGILFGGTGSNNHTLKFNSFHQHLFGSIYLEKDANISPQSAGENTWIGTSSPYEAYMEWDDNTPMGPYNPNDVSHQLFVFNERGGFTINSPGINNPNDPYWASPREVGGISDMGVWFRQILSGEPSGVLHCKYTSTPPGPDPNYGILVMPPDTTPKTLTPGEELILTDAAHSYLGEGWSWEHKFQLYCRLKDYPELRPTGSTASTWYNNQQNTPMGQLSEVYGGLRNLLTVSEVQYLEMQPEYDSLETLVKQSGEIATALHQASSPAEIAGLSAQRQANATATLEQTEIYQDLLENFRTGALQQANTVLTNLDNIIAAHICDANLKSVLTVQLECIISGTGPDENQKSILQEVAGQCRYNGGWAVALARLLMPENTFDDDLLCGSIEKTGLHQATADVPVTLSPNPAKDIIDLRIGQTFTEGIGRIYNSRGELVQQWAFSENTKQTRRLNLLPGIYMVSIYLDGKLLPARKLTIIP